MAADVSSGRKNGRKLVTRDLLGGSGCEIDAPLHWEENIDLLLSGKKKKSGSDPIIHDLNLPPPPSSSSPSSSSVCTIEKVQYALERAKSDGYNSPTTVGSEEDQTTRPGSMMVGVCPGCMQYLLVPVAEPVCPRCESRVPVPQYMKPKKSKFIDLNCSS